VVRSCNSHASHSEESFDSAQDRLRGEEPGGITLSPPQILRLHFLPAQNDKLGFWLEGRLLQGLPAPLIAFFDHLAHLLARREVTGSDYPTLLFRLAEQLFSAGGALGLVIVYPGAPG
jgi:hypothetical protein